MKRYLILAGLYALAAVDPVYAQGLNIKSAELSLSMGRHELH